jgi:iron complex outermembrane receptor protein
VGYGTVEKRCNRSGNRIDIEDFNKGPVTSADQMIQGKVAGLQIINGGGSPGEGATIRIRSGSSLSANTILYM